MNRRDLLKLIPASVMAFLCPRMMRPRVYRWNGGANDGYFDNPKNWEGGVSPSGLQRVGDTIVFPKADTTSFYDAFN